MKNGFPHYLRYSKHCIFRLPSINLYQCIPLSWHKCAQLNCIKLSKKNAENKIHYVCSNTPDLSAPFQRISPRIFNNTEAGCIWFPYILLVIIVLGSHHDTFSHYAKRREHVMVRLQRVQERSQKRDICNTISSIGGNDIYTCYNTVTWLKARITVRRCGCQ
jgi:hypothetical protein